MGVTYKMRALHESLSLHEVNIEVKHFLGALQQPQETDVRVTAGHAAGQGWVQSCFQKNQRNQRARMDCLSERYK